MIPPLDFLFRFLIFAAIHSILATDRTKTFVARAALPILSTRYRLGYNIISSILFVWLMTGWPNSPVLYVTPGGWYLLLRAGQLLALIAAIRCLMQTGLADFIGFSKTPDQMPLVTTGCYAKVRHPLYTLGIVFLLLEPAPSGKWLVFTLLSGGYFVLAIRWEEKRLGERFGNTYAAYRETVPAFWPRIRH